MLAERVILIVLDSFGVGAMPDAARYGDENANTFLNIDRSVGGLHLPSMEQLGLGRIETKSSLALLPSRGAFGKAMEKSEGKDTTTGHWELMGIVLDQPFPVYPDGFPDDLITRFQAITGRGVIGNRSASGTEIIQQYGNLHLKTGDLIVYTSADSVFQIAAHEEVVPLSLLYEYCEVARRLLTGPHEVGRVIARPFIGEEGNFKRTPHRRDYAIPPKGVTVLDLLHNSGIPAIGIGKIADIFDRRGLTACMPTKNNMDGIDQTIEMMKTLERGLIFTNLVDFDSLFGHRNDITGYARALEQFDQRLPELLSSMKDSDILIITADHGCDPTLPGTDHTREYVPIMVFGNRVRSDVSLGIRETFADIGATVAELLGCELPVTGTSMVPDFYRTE
jgi:phosphopentomutase